MSFECVSQSHGRMSERTLKQHGMRNVHKCEAIAYIRTSSQMVQ